jgi:hypothetical protein
MGAHTFLLEPSDTNRRRAFSLSVFVLGGSLLLLLTVMQNYDPIIDFLFHSLYLDPRVPKEWDPTWIYMLLPLWLLYSRFDLGSIHALYQYPYPI